MDSSLTEADLRPFREHKTLQVLWVWDPNEMRYTEYLNRKGTGEWQLETVAKEAETSDAVQ